MQVAIAHPEEQVLQDAGLPLDSALGKKIAQSVVKYPAVGSDAEDDEAFYDSSSDFSDDADELEDEEVFHDASDDLGFSDNDLSNIDFVDDDELQDQVESSGIDIAPQPLAV